MNNFLTLLILNFLFININCTDNINGIAENIPHNNQIINTQLFNKQLFKEKKYKLIYGQKIKIYQQMKKLLLLFVLIIIINIFFIEMIPKFFNYLKQNFFNSLGYLLQTKDYPSIHIVQKVVAIIKNADNNNVKDLLLTKIFHILLKNSIILQKLISTFFEKTEVDIIINLINSLVFLTCNIFNISLLAVIIILNIFIVLTIHYTNNLYNNYFIKILQNKIKIFLKEDNLDHEDIMNLKLLKYENLLKKKYINSVYFNSSYLFPIIMTFITINYIYYFNFSERQKEFIEFYNNYYNKHQFIEKSTFNNKIIIANFIIFFFILYLNILKKNYIYINNLLDRNLSWNKFCLIIFFNKI